MKDKTQVFRKVFRIGTLQKSFTIFHRLRRKYAFHYEETLSLGTQAQRLRSEFVLDSCSQWLKVSLCTSLRLEK